VLKILFGCTIVFCLSLGVVIVLCFVLALIAGGKFAVSLCGFLRAWLIPALYLIGSSAIIEGLLKMYIAGEKAFVMEKLRWRKKSEESGQE